MLDAVGDLEVLLANAAVTREIASGFVMDDLTVVVNHMEC
jgi:hypothetical protein